MVGKFRREKGLWLNFWVLTLLINLTLLFSLLNVSSAADYPTRPIQIIVTYPPGGGADTTARIVAPKVSELLGQPVVVVNKPGGGGVIGTYATLSAPPDGYTIFVPQAPHLSAPLIMKGVTFNILRDFTMINLSVVSPSVIDVRKDAPWQTMEQLIAEAKKNPGKLTCCGTGYGSTLHFAFELFKMHTVTDITYVPMEGSAPAVAAVLGGHIDVIFLELIVGHKYLQAGSLRGLAVMDKKRLKDFPDIPTTIEKGFPDLISASWGGFAVRSGTPKAIVEKLEKVFKEAINDKKVIEDFQKIGVVVENLGSEEAKEFLVKDLQRKSEVAKAAQMVPK